MHALELARVRVLDMEGISLFGNVDFVAKYLDFSVGVRHAFALIATKGKRHMTS